MKIMAPKTILHLIAAGLIVLFNSCGNNNDSSDRIAQLESQRDSLMMENEQISAFVSTISVSLDSVVLQQGAILNAGMNESQLSKRDQIKRNIEIYADMLTRQRDRIAELEKALEKAEGAHAAKMRSIIASMQKQLDEKDAMIAQLRSEIDSKNANIEQLTGRVSALNKDVANLTEINEAQEEALITQSDMMNEAYVKIGSKKELEKAGILGGGGFLKKKKLDVTGLRSDLFQKIDIRTATTFQLNSKKPQILTQMPESAYQISKNTDGTCTLTITDPTQFWSISNFLVIQL